MSPIAVIDFETTGTSPGMGDRATEVAIVMLEGGQVVDRYQSLMNAGVRVNSFITQLTGITNEMLQAAPPADQVMREAARFVGGRPMVAHNASFDKKFWQDELSRCGQDASHPFACTVLLSRRLYPQAPNHQLGTLAACSGRAGSRSPSKMTARAGGPRPAHGFAAGQPPCGGRFLAATCGKPCS